ncbi:MAG: DUF3078 domain-containing protein [Muribaculaceae bacterium]|nr:DUF3078 domain-containing protein [Muribaculaceae bacterium]
MIRKTLKSIVAAIALLSVSTVAAQTNLNLLEITEEQSIVADTLEIDTTLVVNDLAIPRINFNDLVYDHYRLTDSTLYITSTSGRDSKIFGWLDRQKHLNALINNLHSNYFYNHPAGNFYIESMLPEPPKEYHATVDPSTAKIVIEENFIDVSEVKEAPQAVEIKPTHWLRRFSGSLQFSQAYNSPNWYQGGNNNLNGIGHILYEVKLNQAYHPNLLFESSFQYKLAVNNAPDDTIHAYSISEDLFQINTKFGVKAAKRWYYSMTALFKTQLLNNYKANTRDLTAAFMSPGELNIGLGMSYSYENPKKTINFDLSIAPLSYNLKTCLKDERMDVTSFGISPGHRSVSQYGSNLEAKLLWKMAYNITYASRVYVFSDYTYVQGDWENTFSFDINRYLSTQLYIHLRYDSQTKAIDDSKWHKWQLREVLSFGLSYKFSTF